MDFKQELEKVQAALALLDSETADAIIGETNEEHAKLLQGMEGAHGMMFIMGVSNGMKNTPEVRQMASQAKLAMLTLAHYAYALGKREGQASTGSATGGSATGGAATGGRPQATGNGKRKKAVRRKRR